MKNLFIDLGSNCGQSLTLYSELYPAKSKETIAISVEASKSRHLLAQLSETIISLASRYELIFSLNVAASTDSRPLRFFDGLGEGSSALPYKYRYTLSRSLKGFLVYLKCSFMNLVLPSSSLYSSIDVASFIPASGSKTSIDLKIDIEGSEYNVIDHLCKQFSSHVFETIFIEIHGAKAGRLLVEDFKVIDQCRFLASYVLNWEAAATNSVDKIFPLYYSDLSSLRCKHLARSNRLKLLYKISWFLFLPEGFLRVFCRKIHYKFLPFRDTFLYNISIDSFRLAPGSKKYIISKDDEAILTSSKFDLTKEPQSILLSNVSNSSSQIFGDSDGSISFFSAVQGQSELVRHTGSSRLMNEVYRFVHDPLIVCPSILRLVTSCVFEEVFSTFPDMRLAGVNLRRCFDCEIEDHTTSFHRDYNGFNTFKLFVPLISGSLPFLEYCDSSSVDLRFPHYSPSHEGLSRLKSSYIPRVRTLSADLSSLSMVNTSCIHRQSPAFCGDILILTFLNHPDYGTRFLRARRTDLDAINLSPWSERFLSFVNLI